MEVKNPANPSTFTAAQVLELEDVLQRLSKEEKNGMAAFYVLKLGLSPGLEAKRKVLGDMAKSVGAVWEAVQQIAAPK